MALAAYQDAEITPAGPIRGCLLVRRADGLCRWPVVGVADALMHWPAAVMLRRVANRCAQPPPDFTRVNSLGR